MITILDSDKPIDNNNYTSTKFSGGEIHIDLSLFLPNDLEYISLSSLLNNSDDIMEVLLFNDALVRYIPKIKIYWELPYLPYARQDRVCSKGQSFSLQVFSSLLNSMTNVRSIVTYDVHSLEASNLIPLLANISQSTLFLLKEKNCNFSEYYLVSPDKGSLGKINELSSKKKFKGIIYSNKVRDPETGNIVKTEIDNLPPKDSACIIVDDICDGGRTFVEIAKILKQEAKVKKVILWVTHGIFSKGEDLEFIDEIKYYHKHKGDYNESITK